MEETWNKLAKWNPFHAAIFGVSHEEIIEPILERLHFPDGKKLLDAGGGYGRNSIPLSRKYKKSVIVSVDISRHMTHLCHNRSNKRVLNIAASLKHLPIKDRSIDITFSFLTVQHQPLNDIKLILTEFKRVTAEKIIFDVPNTYSFDGILFFPLLLMRKIRNRKIPKEGYLMNSFSYYELRQLLDEVFDSEHFVILFYHYPFYITVNIPVVRKKVTLPIKYPARFPPRFVAIINLNDKHNKE
ncbi:MAG: class I SAM-dependent methyltransferase [Nitrososphaeria archaeon]